MIKLLYDLYQVCIALPLVLILTILVSITTMIGSLFNAHFWGYWPAHLWGRMVCTILLLPVKVEGREQLKPGTSYVFVPNHQGAFDIFLVYGYLNRNFKWMMKKSLRKLPFVGKACESGGHIFVDRSSPSKVRHTMEQAEASLVNGVSLVVFPEGARTWTGRMGAFKRGAFQLADDLQLPVVPVSINGSFRVLRRGGRWIHWHPLSMTIHAPIPPHGKGHEHILQTLEEARMAVASAVKEEQEMAE